MKLFRVYVDGALFYHPQMSRLAITQAQVQEDAENIDRLTLSAPHSHPYIDRIRPLSSTIVLKKEIRQFSRAGLWMMGRISITPTHGTASPASHT